ncbi:MAG TPA: hypothetical protein VF727_06660 [Allosphingosinicella sp.]|jgi:hypothetical protein
MDNGNEDDPSPGQPGGAGEAAGPGAAVPGSAGPGVPAQRKPRIEVLRPGAPAAPEPGVAPPPGKPGIEVLGGAGQAAPQVHSPRIASNQPQQVEAPTRRRRGGLLRSPAALFSIVALLVIAAALLYTYSQRDRGSESAGTEDAATSQEEAVRSENAELLPKVEAYGEAPPTSEPGEDVTREDAARSASAGEEPAAAEPAPPVKRPAPAASGAGAADAPQPPAPEPPSAGPATTALTTVRAFYGALSAGDGAAAAQLVVPAKRQSGPLSAGALSRYYSSFRRPLRVRRVTPVDDDTVRVAYDYVLADGRLCAGQATVNVVRSGGRALVSGIRTQGPC